MVILLLEPRVSSTPPSPDTDVGATDGKRTGVPGRTECIGGVYRGVYTRVYIAGYPSRVHSRVSHPGYIAGYVTPVPCWICYTCTMLGMPAPYRAGYAGSLPCWVCHSRSRVCISRSRVCISARFCTFGFTFWPGLDLKHGQSCSQFTRSGA